MKVKSLSQNTGVGNFSLLQGNLPNSGVKPRSPTLQAGSLPPELPGKLPFHGRTTAKPKPNTQKLVLVDSGSQYKVHIEK